MKEETRIALTARAGALTPTTPLLTIGILLCDMLAENYGEDDNEINDIIAERIGADRKNVEVILSAAFIEAVARDGDPVTERAQRTWRAGVAAHAALSDGMRREAT